MSLLSPALLFTALLTFFIVNKSNKSLVTPVQNQPITVFRIWNNVYIHYIPAVILRLIKGFNDKDLSNTCLAGAVGLLGCWLGRYWEVIIDDEQRTAGSKRQQKHYTTYPYN